MKKILLMLMLMMSSALLIQLAGCDAFSSKPTYDGLSLEGFNYTPYNLTRFVIKDKYGNKATGGGDLPPGAGEGSLSCCYQLKGTEFTVEWKAYDLDAAAKRRPKSIDYINMTTEIHIPPTDIRGGAGTRILGLHFYPDMHVEPEFRTDLSGSRFDYGVIDSRLLKKYGAEMNPGGSLNWAEVFRRTARIAGEGWKRYRLTDNDDLEQYVYFTLLVDPDFDQHPDVKKIIADTRGRPGAFAAAMRGLSPSAMEELRLSNLAKRN